MKDDPIKLWQHAHGASIHFPIALIIVALLFDAGALLFKKDHWRTVSFWCLLIAAGLSVPACLSGLWGQLGWGGGEKWDAESINKHRNLALISSGVMLALALWRTLVKDRLSPRLQWVYLVLELIAVGIVGYTGFVGGYVARGY